MTAHVLPPASGSLTGLQPWVRQEEHGSAADIMSRQQNGAPQPPPGLPGHVSGPMGWSGQDTPKMQAHELKLDDVRVPMVEQGLQSFYRLELDGDEVTRERFPLPHLESLLEQCSHEVHRGSGLCIVRGLKPSKYTSEDNIVLFLALASYIGDQRGIQNAKGDVLSHVTESKSWTVPREKRHGIHTNESLPFHTDMGCEILSIQVRDRADAGGHTCVASIVAIYNDLLQTNPCVLHTLARHDWPIQTSSRKDPPFVLSPLLESYGGNLFISMDPCRIGPHPLSHDSPIPCLTEEQEEALAVLQTTARKHQLRLETQPGDLIFINNLGLLHARESYQDGTSSRHLVRLWLRNTQLGWDIPPSMRMPWDAAFGDGSRKILNRYYPIVPMPEYMECKYSSGTAAFVADDDTDDASDANAISRIKDGHMYLQPDGNSSGENT
ncbi:Clavaminate synthase-like protein [Hypomontagnella monticulosa]|nr:Clavaminate synthase-like protein [Hypomontagnella monticulosa]